MLTTCAACGQVIEIATLTEHLLDECDSRAEYSPCAVCAAAVRGAELASHRAAAACAPPPADGGARCPLCAAPVPRDGWPAHLMAGACPCNPRRGRV